MSEEGALPPESRAGTPPLPRPPRWQVLHATARGAAHEATGRPLQDAVACLGDASRPGDVLAVAVADGHGHPRHSRSGRGSAMAVDVASAAALEHGGRLTAAEAAPDVLAAAQAAIIPAVIERWRAAVAGDLAGESLTETEAYWLRPGEDPSVAYGTTLLLAVVAYPWLAMCQIGDGDIVVVDASGRAELPVPGDDRLDGRQTTSLCQSNALASFRCGAVDLRSRPVAAVLLATDGFGNAQSADPWPQPVGADLVSFARGNGIAWMREQLPIWVQRCASAEGSADDTAVALLLPEDPAQVSAAPAAAAGPQV